MTPIDRDYDTASTVADPERWLKLAGLSSYTTWAHHDLAVIVGEATAAA